MTPPPTAVKERPILFSGPMVRAILEGRKTQTRRVIKPQPVGKTDAQWIDYLAKKPYRTGDRLWVRETFALESDYEFPDEKLIPTDRPVKKESAPDEGEWHTWAHYKATDPIPELCCDSDRCAQCGDDGNGFGPHWRPSIHMPRWASRITLEITNVRVERIRDITDRDIRAEGYDGDFCNSRFSDSWNEIYPGSWDRNDWVWVIEFKRVTP